MLKYVLLHVVKPQHGISIVLDHIYSVYLREWIDSKTAESIANIS